jgi:hypothetical protein
MKNASNSNALPIEPEANVSVPTANAATPPLRVSECERTATIAMSAATMPPRKRSWVLRR